MFAGPRGWSDALPSFGAQRVWLLLETKAFFPGSIDGMVHEDL
jgi:hypothetical protein